MPIYILLLRIFAQPSKNWKQNFAPILLFQQSFCSELIECSCDKPAGKTKSLTIRKFFPKPNKKSRITFFLKLSVSENVVLDTWEKVLTKLLKVFLIRIPGKL